MEKDFANLIATLKSSIKTWEYFVNWKKVFFAFFNLRAPDFFF